MLNIPAGKKDWYGYLVKNLKYPEKAVKNNIQGNVYVEFIIRKEGTPTDIKVVTGPEELKQASVQVIANKREMDTCRK